MYQTQYHIESRPPLQQKHFGKQNKHLTHKIKEKWKIKKKTWKNYEIKTSLIFRKHRIWNKFSAPVETEKLECLQSEVPDA